MRVKANIGTIEILFHLIVWFVIIVCTFGIGAYFFAYSFSKFVINRTQIIDNNGETRTMVCHTDMFGNIGHIILWIIMTILTFGLAYLFYFYKVWNYSLNHSTIE